MRYSAKDVALWILNEAKIKNIPVSPLRLQKLLYYCQGYTLGMTAHALFDDDFVAWAHGPVVRDVYHQYKKYGNQHIDSFDSAETPAEFRGTICRVLEEKGRIDPIILSGMTHEESPYKLTGQNEIITNKCLDEYFSQLFWSPDEEDEYEPTFDSEKEERQHFIKNFTKEEYNAIFADC